MMKGHILIIEDDQDMGEMLDFGLSRRGFTSRSLLTAGRRESRQSPASSRMSCSPTSTFPISTAFRFAGRWRRNGRISR